MNSYDYEATDPEGQYSTGTIEAESAHVAVVSLQEDGYRVSWLSERARPGGFFKVKGKLTLEDLSLLNEQLHAIAKSGLSMPPSLRAVAQDVKAPVLKSVVMDICSSLEAGRSLEEALNKHPRSFSPVYRSLVRAGEQTGNLPAVLAQLSAYSAQMVRLKNRFREVLTYPLLVFF